MIVSIKPSLVRIVRGEQVFGNGFLGPDGLIVTCAHVVADAVGHKQRASPPDAAEGLQVCFHWVDGKPSIVAHVVKSGWRYAADEVDISLLRLAGPVPATARPLNLAGAAKERFSAELEPFIPTLTVSRRILAEVDGRDENGRLIIVPAEPTRQWIEPGVSGAPVFLREGELVEGIVIQDDIAVQQAFLLPASMIRTVLADVADAPSQSSDFAGTAPIVASGIAREAHVKAFLGSDPIAGAEAAEALVAAGPAGLSLLLSTAVGTPQQVLRLRKLCSRLGEAAVQPLIGAIVNGHWTEKTSAASCFSSFENNRNVDNILYESLKISDFDVRRNVVSACGHSGYSGSVRWEIVRYAKYDQPKEDAFSFSDYSFGKLYDYVIESLWRGFSRSGDRSELSYIQDFIEFCAERGLGAKAERVVDSAIEDVRPVAADALCADWLARPDGPWAAMALEALAQLRLRRTVEIVGPYLYDKREDVRMAAGRCLGSTGCDTAAEHVSFTLADRPLSGGVLWASSMLCWRGDGWPTSGTCLEAAQRGGIETFAQMLVSIALRDRAAAAGIIRRELSNRDPLIRGASAIAFAYADPAEAAGYLFGSADEAASEIERLLIATAEVLAGRRDRRHVLYDALNQSTFWPRLRPFWRYQVLAALRLAQDDPCRHAFWEELSRDDMPRIRSLVGEFAARANA